MTYRSSFPLICSGGKTYYLRARGFAPDSVGICGPSPAAVTRFTTRGDCAFVRSVDTGAVIDESLFPAEMTVGLPAGTIEDMDVFVELNHSFIEDLTIELLSYDPASPAPRITTLYNRQCREQDNMILYFDDEAPEGDLPCPPTDGGFYRPPVDALSQLDGLESGGLWVLSVTDNANVDQGKLTGFAVSVCGLTELPVSWLDFTAAGQKDHITLNWAISEATDNAGFYVERQRTTDDGWTELDFVGAGAGAILVEEHSYTFDDRTALPNTDYLYRLRQTDLDGAISYSPLAAARYGATTLALDLYPNPSGGKVNYRIGGADGSLPYHLLDANNGRLLRTGLLHADGGLLEVDGLASGVYFLRAGGRVFRVVLL